MSAKIREVEFTPPFVNDNVVEMLEAWLVRAKSGEVHSIALAGVTVQGWTSNEWSVAQPDNKFHLLNSSIAILQHRFLAANECDHDR